VLRLHKRPEANGEIAAGVSDNQPKEIVNVLSPAIKMNIERAHAILGHSSEDTTCRTAAALNMLITRGTLKTCESCEISKQNRKTSIKKVREQKQTSSMVEFIMTLQW
jgi:hypothetical protein